MAVEERDAHSGYLTTGHEWNGIKELNSPVPRVVYFFLIVTALFSLVYWVLMPAWPIGWWTYTKGLLGNDQRTIVADSLKQAALDRAAWMNRIQNASFEEIQKDPRMMDIVRQTGRTLFGDNCAACHGREAKGGPGFPNLTTSAWLWGDSPETIAETIRVGINSAHRDSRRSQMPAVGRLGMLPRNDVLNVVAYVQSLSNPSAPAAPADKIAAGKAAYATSCAACHGENGQGNEALGAPSLADKLWIYGGDPDSIFNTIWNGRQGQMPTWESRLSAVDRKILALYLVDLRSAKP